MFFDVIPAGHIQDMSKRRDSAPLRAFDNRDRKSAFFSVVSVIIRTLSPNYFRRLKGAKRVSEWNKKRIEFMLRSNRLRRLQATARRM